MNPRVRLRVRVIPNAQKTAFNGYRDSELVVRVNTPALDGRANRAALKFIAEYFGVSRSSVTLLSGEKSRHKIFEIVGLNDGALEGKLAGIQR